jgi:hypothetical protein
MKKLFFTLSLFFLIVAVYSCYYDNAEFLYPKVNTTCDTANVTFNSKISPMLQNSCLPSCHSNASAAGNVKLENYADVVAHSARVLGAIQHLSGFSPMPKYGGSLDACTIRQFEIWVANGKPQ